MSISSTRGNLYVMNSSTWKAPTGVSYHNGTAWNPVQKVYVMTGTEWEQVWPAQAGSNEGATILMIELDGSAGVANDTCLNPRWYLTGTGGVKDFLYGTSKIDYPYELNTNTSDWGKKQIWYRGNRAVPTGAYIDTSTNNDQFDLSDTSDGYRRTRLTFHGKYDWIWDNETWHEVDTTNSFPAQPFTSYWQSQLPTYQHYYYTRQWKFADYNLAGVLVRYAEEGDQDWPVQHEYGEVSGYIGSDSIYNPWKWSPVYNNSSFPIMTSTIGVANYKHPPLRCFINLSVLKFLFPNEKIYIQGSAQWQEFSGYHLTKGSTQVGMKATVIKGSAGGTYTTIPSLRTQTGPYDDAVVSESPFVRTVDPSTLFFNGTWNAQVGDPNNYAENGDPADIPGMMNINELSNDKITVNSSYQLSVGYGGMLSVANQDMGDRIGCIEIDLATNEIKFVSDDLTSEAKSVFNVSSSGSSFPWYVMQHLEGQSGVIADWRYPVWYT